jgi:hypothetical protein
MKARLYLFTLMMTAVFTIGSVKAQQASLKRVPKQISFETGYRILLSVTNFDTDVKHGVGFLVDYAWQLSGLDGSKPAVYISVPLGYTSMIPGSDTSSELSMLCYGWTIRHQLAKDKKWIPYLGYGLLLNKIRESNRDGSVMGHKTQFEFGYNIKTSRKLQYLIKIQYSYSSFPRLDDKEKIKTHFFDIRAGIRF